MHLRFKHFRYDNQSNFVSRSKPARGLVNRLGDQKLYKWVLSKTKASTHCPDCTSRAGKVKTISDWKAMGKPKCKCKCKLVPVSERGVTMIIMKARNLKLAKSYT